MEKEIEKEIDKDIKGKGAGKGKPELIYPFESLMFRGVWDAWKKYRSEIKKPYKGVISEQAALKSLSKYEETTAMQMIEKAMASSWQSFHELNNNNYGGKQLTKIEQQQHDILQRHKNKWSNNGGGAG